MATQTPNPWTAPIKQPAEELDYDFIFDNLLLAGEEIVDSAVVATVTPAITLGATEPSATRVKQWCSGGTAKTKPKLTCDIWTNQGRHYQREMYIPIKEQ